MSAIEKFLDRPVICDNFISPFDEKFWILSNQNGSCVKFLVYNTYGISLFYLCLISKKVNISSTILSSFTSCTTATAGQGGLSKPPPTVPIKGYKSVSPFSAGLSLFSRFFYCYEVPFKWSEFSRLKIFLRNLESNALGIFS